MGASVPPFAGAATQLSIERDASGVPRLSAEAASGDVIVVEATPDLESWTERLRAHGPFEDIADLTFGGAPAAFYRALARPRADGDDWKNVVHGDGNDPFQSEPVPRLRPEPRWIKFAILLDDPHRVYFQDSGRYLFHYDFAVTRLPGFGGMTRSEFDAVTLRIPGQRAVLGAVLFAPASGLNEIAIQLVGHDAYPRERVAEWFHTVRAMVVAPSGMGAFYLPTFEQADVARTNRDWFESVGIPIGSAGRWVSGNDCYAPGWTLGRLVFVPGGEIADAYRLGRIGPRDVLLTDAVPAEVPPLSGIVSLSPATPNSHVALLARSFGIPFVHLEGDEAEAELRSWDGRDVLVRAIEQFLGCEVSVTVLGSPLDPGMREELLALKDPPQLEVSPIESAGALHLGVDGLGPADIRFVGGKAANLGILRQAIPEHSPDPVLAFTFDLWDGYLGQILPDGRTLRRTVNDALEGLPWPPDMGALQTTLAELRELFRNGTDFSAGQKEAILGILQDAGFDTHRRIRFRSSTNVEDSEHFTGAGLYDSYSGCLADDLDGDTRGPSHCNPAENNERGVFRALRRVFASFYNDNAVLERLRHGVNEADVGMAVLVHYSTPDEIELANGVGTLSIQRSGGQRTVEATLVTQAGAVSVSNPDNTAVPEVVKVSHWAAFLDPTLVVESRSSLVPLGGTVLEWPSEYEALYGLLNTAGQRWEAGTPGRSRWVLDFEYKKIAPDGHLSVKQIRPIPLPPSGVAPTDWLLNTTNRWGVLQGEFANVYSLHRLKSFWTLPVRHTRVGAGHLDETLFGHIEGMWMEDTGEQRLSGSITNLPGHRFERAGNRTEDAWSSGDATRFLRVNLDRFALPEAGPIAILDDLRLEVGVRHATARSRPNFGPDGTVTMESVEEETVSLVPIRRVHSESLRQERQMTWGERRVTTTFYWPPHPKGPTAGYTAPLEAWVETTMEGFTTRPIRLRGDFSQTYRPGHHNFSEDFLFDPWLEPDVDPDLLAELAADNVRGVVVIRSIDGDAWYFLWGLDGTFRTAP